MMQVPPILGQAGYSALSFAGYNSSLKLLPGDPCSNLNIFIAGCGGGALSSLVTSPCDLIKINRQTAEHKLPLGTLIRALLRERGVLGLYSGWLATLSRDTPSTGVYFLVYTTFKRQCSDMGRVNSELLAGGTAGK